MMSRVWMLGLLLLAGCELPRQTAGPAPTLPGDPPGTTNAPAYGPGAPNYVKQPIPAPVVPLKAPGRSNVPKSTGTLPPRRETTLEASERMVDEKLKSKLPCGHEWAFGMYPGTETCKEGHEFREGRLISKHPY